MPSDSINIQHAYTVRDAANLAGLSTSMIDYLCRAGIVVPSMMGSRGRGRGRGRRYSFGDIILLRTYARLLKQGVSVKRLKQAQKTWSRHYKKTMDHGALPPARFLLTDGERIYFRESAEIVSDLTTSGQLAFSFVVDLHKVRDEVLEKARASGRF